VLGFVRGVDPYDRPWKPLRSRDGQPLRDSGRLQNSVAGAHLNVTQTGFRITTNVKYAATHQYGATIRAKNARFRFGGLGDEQDMVTGGKPMLVFRVGGPRPRKNGRWVSKAEVTIPRRQYMPEGNVGPRWAAALEGTADLVIQRIFGGP
jgi:phage gpG-like protein